MRHSKVLVAAALVVLAFTVRSSPAQPSAGSAFVAGEILVKFRPGITANARADAHRQARGRLLNEIARTRVQLVGVAAGDETAAIGRYRRNPNVLYAEPHFIRNIPAPVSHTSGSEVVPGDYFFREQWALHNTGQPFLCIAWIGGELCFYVGTPNADIDAPEAWAMSNQGLHVKVAVIDSGIDYNHPDLTANYAGGDDFIFDDGDPMDDHGHGTHVAGTIAAAINNPTGDPAAAEGVIGVAPHARILAYKVCRSDGTCSDFAIARAIVQAITDGARVINMSLGSSAYSQSLYDAVQDAWNANVVIVAAAGNAGTTAPVYPAAFDNVISVAAFDEDHKRPAFSSYGSWVDISAPGNVIMSTYPLAACGGLSTVPGDTGCYTWDSGTSMAAPHVSGAAALVWSRDDVTSNSRVVDLLLESANPQGVAPVRLDAWTAHGGLNLRNALSHGVTNLPPVANAGPDQTVTDDDRNGVELVTLDGSASYDPDGRIDGYEWRNGSTVIGFSATEAVWLPVGLHTLTLEVTDEHGGSGTDEVVVTVLRPNDAPVAVATSAQTILGMPVTVTLHATDDGTCELVFSVVQGPSSGTLGAVEDETCTAGAPNSDTARVTYTPGALAGTYSFTYKANDGSADSNAATVTVTVSAGDPPPGAAVAVTGIDPNAVSQNAGTVTFIVTGTGFADGAGVTFADGTGPAPRVLSVARMSSTSLAVTAEIRPGGPKKDRSWDVRVTNPNGFTGTGVGLLTITP